MPQSLNLRAGNPNIVQKVKVNLQPRGTLLLRDLQTTFSQKIRAIRTWPRCWVIHHPVFFTSSGICSQFYECQNTFLRKQQISSASILNKPDTSSATSEAAHATSTFWFQVPAPCNSNSWFSQEQTGHDINQVKILLCGSESADKRLIDCRDCSVVLKDTLTEDSIIWLIWCLLRHDVKSTTQGWAQRLFGYNLRPCTPLLCFFLLGIL